MYDHEKEKLKPVPENIVGFGAVGGEPPLLLITEEGGWIRRNLARLLWPGWGKVLFVLMLLLLGMGWLTGHTADVLQLLGAIQVLTQGNGALGPPPSNLTK